MALPGALVAIEPPMDSRPIPPQEPPAAVPVPAEQKGAPAAPADDEALPMPRAGEARPFLGVILDPVPELLAGHLKLAPGEGVVIGDLVPGGPAGRAGLAAGDVVLEVAGTGVGSAEAVRAEVERHKVGDEIEVAVIQGGERHRKTLTLGEAPEVMPGFGGAGEPLDGFLEDLPERHADLIREALERNLRAFENLENNGGMADQLQRGLMRRLEKEMGANGMQMKKLDGLDAETTFRFLDEEGSVEMTQRNGHKEVRVCDKAGELLWEGPYDTEQDKAAVPDGIRERLERLNIGMELDFNDGGMKLRLGPNRFRPLQELDEADRKEDAPDEGEAAGE